MSLGRVLLVLASLLRIQAEEQPSQFLRQQSLEDAIKALIEAWDIENNTTTQFPFVLSNQTNEDVVQEDVEEYTPSNDYEENLVPNSNCSGCILEKESKAMRLEKIKFDILHKLGLQKVPNITAKSLQTIPPIHKILDRYGMQSDRPFTPGEEFEDETEVSAERVISFAQSTPSFLLEMMDFEPLYFKFSELIQKKNIRSAKLWVYTKPRTALNYDPVSWIIVYHVTRPRPLEKPTLVHYKTQKVSSSSREGQWVVIDVRKILNEWFLDPVLNLGLVIHSYDNNGTVTAYTDTEGDNKDMIPFIELHVEKPNHRRVKRTLGLNCEEKSKEVRCCRYPLTVDFEDFGWDWIIAPKRYEANYCSGECPYVFLQKYPHTHLVQQINPQGSAGPCCAPRKMSAISMLYFDEDYNVIYGMLPGMVVERCGCS